MWEGDVIMKDLRLVFENDNGEKEDIALPVERWIADWWFECNIVPSNDTVILVAELDGKSILSNIKTTDGRYIQFEEIAQYFYWDWLYYGFISVVNSGVSFKNNSTDFEKWLLQNMD